MYSRASASQIRDPSPRFTTKGSPPTPRNARTGELTPPGNNARARSIRSCERVVTEFSAPEASNAAQDGQRAGNAWRRGWRSHDAHQRRADIDVLDHLVE